MSRRAIVIAVAIALVVLGGVGTGIYFLTKGDDAPSASSGQTTGGPAPATDTPVPGGSSAPAPQPAQPTPGDPPPGEPGDVRAVAELAVQAINAHDPEALKKISCDPGAIGPADNTPPEAKVELASNPELTGDTATVSLKLTIGDQSTITPLPLRKNNGSWCVD